MEAVRAEMQKLEQAVAELRAAIAVEYPRRPGHWSVYQCQAQRWLGNWALALAEEQELAIWAALGLPPPEPGEVRPEAGLWSRGRSTRAAARRRGA